MARLLKPHAGRVLLDGEPIHDLSTREVVAPARRCCRRARSRPTACSSATWSAAAGTRTSAGSASGPPTTSGIVEAALRMTDTPTCATGRSTSSPAASASAPGSR